jgi:choline dehydrogenase-like flavoprotein
MSGGYDVIIIGTGAGGGTLAQQLARSGKRILLLERGDFLPRESGNWDAGEVFGRNRYVTPDPWTDTAGKTFQPQSHYFVGGATKVYGAALYRLRAEDFGEIRHRDGVSPAWPIGYDDLEPYYTRAEALYQVRGARGEDPTEPAASAPYPHPAVSHEPRIQRLSDDLMAQGFQPFHSPNGVGLDEADPQNSACVRCGTCDGFPCLVRAKADAEVLGVRPALRHSTVTLMTRSRALRLETNAAGNAVTGVVVEQDGHLSRYSGDIVVVACGAANSAKLLLSSASDRHPSGLANGSDEVGRNFMFHEAQAVLALSKQPNPTVYQKTLALNDFYHSGPDFGYPMGNIQLMGRSKASMYRGESELAAALSATWTLGDVASHAVDFLLTSEDLPQSHNRVQLNADGTIRLRHRFSNPSAGRALYRQLLGMLGGLGCHPEHLVRRFAYLKHDRPVAGVANQSGTCRFGTDPASSVLDLTCKAHELDNLYVVDASFLPSIGAVNPALTVMANALRVGDHLLQRLAG